MNHLRAGNLQQIRWSPAISQHPQAALARLYMLPGARYTDPEFSGGLRWRPRRLVFGRGRDGAAVESDMGFVGASPPLFHGYLLRFKFNSSRQHFSFTDLAWLIS